VRNATYQFPNDAEKRFPKCTLIIRSLLLLEATDRQTTNGLIEQC